MRLGCRLGAGRYRLRTICCLVDAARNEHIKMTEFCPICMTALPRGELSSSSALCSAVLRFYRRSYDYCSKIFAHINFALNNPEQESYHNMQMIEIDGLEVFWTSSTSESDYDGRLLRILEAEIGHLHFHTNTKSSRIQVWILESKSWEEHAVKRGESMVLKIEEMVRESYWLGLVCNARRRRFIC